MNISNVSVSRNRKGLMKELRGKPERAFELIADFLKASRTVMDRVWGNNDRYKFTTSVAIKAVIRVLGDLMESSDTIERWQENPGPRVFEKKIAACTEAWSIALPGWRRRGKTRGGAFIALQGLVSDQSASRNFRCSASSDSDRNACSMQERESLSLRSRKPSAAIRRFSTSAEASPSQ